MAFKKILLIISSVMILIGVLHFDTFIISATTSYTQDFYTYTISNNEITITACNSNNTNIIIPEKINGYNVTNLADYAFANCTSTKKITMPDSIINIGSYAFDNCSNLESIIFSKNIKHVGYNAFQQCENLKNVYISDLTSWCEIDFASQHSNPALYANNLFINGELVREISIPECITDIKKYTFDHWQRLEKVYLHENIKSMEYSAFNYCTSIQEVHISDLDAWCRINFESCGNPLTYSGNLYLNGKAVTEVAVPEDVTELRYTFLGCDTIKSIKLHDNLTLIGTDAFSGCASLLSIDIPYSVKKIDHEAFVDCRSLANLLIPNGVTYIGDFAFWNCYNLTNVNIQNAATQIERFVFDNCNYLTVYCHIGIIPSRLSKYGYNYKCFGDFDNDKKLSSTDTVLMRKSLLGEYDENYDEKVADISQDNNFDIRDLVHLKKKLAGIIA